MTTTDSMPRFADLRAAHDRIRGHITRTPVLTAAAVDSLLGAAVFFKCENQQRIGAFKARGAFSRLTLLSPEERLRGVVAYSSGNHAQAVALAGRELGIAATIVMPADAPKLKLQRTSELGARVILYDRAGGEDREAVARRLLEETGGIRVPPFDDPAVVAGQGTAGIELFEEVPNLDAVLVPTGGGGLLAGIALAAQALSPQTRIYGVEPEAGDDVRRSLRAGTPITIPVPVTLADCLQTTRMGDIPFAILRALEVGVVTATDMGLRRAMAHLHRELGQVVEPGGATGLAAMLEGALPELQGKRVGVILSGGNVDPERFRELISIP